MKGIRHRGTGKIGVLHAVMDGHFHPSKVAAIGFDLGLKEMTARLNAPPHHHFERGARKQLEAARHIGLFGPQHQIG